jgi:diguanylate cyclase (GGDEF)-like protein
VALLISSTELPEHWYNRVATSIERLHWKVTSVVAVSLVVVVASTDAAIDRLAGSDINLVLLYLVPVAFGAWTGRARMGWVISTLSALSAVGPHLISSPEQSLALSLNMGVDMLVFLSISYVLPGLRSLLEHEKLVSRTDHLTGVANSRALRERALREILRARKHGYELSVAYLDVDDFKAINDKHGHAGGDRILKLISSITRQALRSTDMVARVGGDEFALLLPNTGAAAAKRVVERVRSEVYRASQAAGVEVTLSIGVKTFADIPLSVEELVESVDLLMYSVKRDRKDDVVYA